MDDAQLEARLNQIDERLDYIEEHLVAMSRAGARLAYVPMGRAATRPTDASNVPDEVVALAQAGKRKEAVVRYRELTGADVQHAISVVDGLAG